MARPSHRYKLHGMACAMFAVAVVFMSQAARHVGDLKLMEDADAVPPAGDVSSGPPSLFSELGDGKQPAEGGKKDGGGGMSDKEGRSLGKFSRGVGARQSGRRKKEAEENESTRPQPSPWRLDDGRNGRGVVDGGAGRAGEEEVGRRNGGTGGRRERRVEVEREREEGRGGARNGREDYRQVTPYAYPGERMRQEDVPQIPRNGEIPRDFSRPRQYPHLLPSDVIKTTGV